MVEIKKNLLRIVIVTFILVLPILSLAVDGDDDLSTPTPVKIENPLTGVNSITDLVRTILEGVIKIGIPVIALAIIYCGFLFVSAQGKPESIKKAKDALLYTLIGAAILLGSWAIAQLISETVLAL